MILTEPPHSADEAGGEAIFTSDGLPALIAPLPPPPLNNDGRRHAAAAAAAADNDDDDNVALVIEEELDPRMAFQAFSHHPPTNAAGWILDRPAADTTTAAVDDDDVDVEHDGILTNWAGKEDPLFFLRRLHRLKAEIDTLEAALNTNATESNDDNNKDDDTNVKTMMIELKSRIDALGMTQHSSSSLSASLARKRQAYLSRIIVDKTSDENKVMIVHDLYHQEQRRQQQQKEEDGDVTNPSSTTSPPPTTQQQQQQQQQASLLEERLRRLENVMGYNTIETTTTTTTTTNKSILERIEEAEHLTREMTDGTQLEKLAAKAKVIRADLEAAARAKTKLGSSSCANPSTTALLEDSQVISTLHAQLIELDGISTHLPALTLRLLELSNLHTQAAEFAYRLTDAELAVSRSERVLLSVEASLKKMEDGWKENTNVLERNVKRLDDMMLRLLNIQSDAEAQEQ